MFVVKDNLKCVLVSIASQLEAGIHLHEAMHYEAQVCSVDDSMGTPDSI